MNKPRLDFVILGAHKCGTTSLHRYLQQQKGIFLPDQKETGFFVHLAGSEWHSEYHPWIRDWQRFAALYQHAGGGQKRGEATPSNLATPGVETVLREHYPDARLVVLLRNPVARILSHYRMWQRIRPDVEPLQEFLDAATRETPIVRETLYAKHLGRFLEHFPRDQLGVWTLEQMQQDPATVVRGAMELVGADASAVDTTGFGVRFNEARQPRTPLAKRIIDRPGIGAAARTLLPGSVRTRIFRALTEPEPPQARDAALPEWLARDLRADVQELERLLGRRLPELAVDTP